MQQQDEQVWALLLGKAWQPLDPAVVCKLLCCSSSMAQLIHSTCVGRLHVHISRDFRTPMLPHPAAAGAAGTHCAPGQQAPARITGTPAATAAASDPLSALLSNVHLPSALAARQGSAQAAGPVLQPLPHSQFVGPIGRKIHPDSDTGPENKPPMDLQQLAAAAADSNTGPENKPPKDLQQLAAVQGGLAGPCGIAAGSPAAARQGAAAAAPAVQGMLLSGPMGAMLAAAGSSATAPPPPAAAAVAAAAAGGGTAAPAMGSMQPPQPILYGTVRLPHEVPLGMPVFQRDPSWCQAQRAASQQEDVRQARWHSRWLAKNARLMSQLDLFMNGPVESLLVEGLSTAAAAAADVDSPAAPAAAAATAASSDEPSAPAAAATTEGVSLSAAAGLPLQSLMIRGSSSGSLLLALAGSCQLTKLDFCWPSEGEAAPGLEQAFCSLVGLRDLRFSESVRGLVGFNWEDKKATTAAAAAPTVFEQLTPAMRAFTQLKQLKVDRVPLRNCCVQPLPASLRSLHLGSDYSGGVYVVAEREDLDLAHLTALTHLKIEDLQESDVLPGSLVELNAPNCISLRPVLGLQQLQKLDLQTVPPHTELAQLSELCPALTEVNMHAGCHEMEFTPRVKALKAAAPHLPALPLKRLVLSTVPIKSWLLGPLSQCAHLKELDLQYPSIEVRLDGFGAALQQLTSLERLSIERPEFSGAAWKLPPSDTPTAGLKRGQKASLCRGALMRKLAQMPNLRVLHFGGFGDEDAVLELAAATQLKSLTLYECWLDKTAAAAQLASELGAAGVDVDIID